MATNLTKQDKLHARIAELERKLAESEAQSFHRQSQAYNNLHKFGDSLMGSCCIITIEALGGRSKIQSFAINDGLSEEAINRIKSDIKRSIDLTINHPINKLVG